MIVLDTSAVVALQDRRDRWYPAALEAVRDEPGPFVVPLAILAEVDAVLRGRSVGAIAHVLGSVQDGSLLLDAGESDTPRVAALLAAAGQPRLTLADAAAVACAERNGGRLLTFAPSPYDQLAREGVVSLVPSVGS
jgi:predicted nucleic acid-binding protein